MELSFCLALKTSFQRVIATSTKRKIKKAKATCALRSVSFAINFCRDDWIRTSDHKTPSLVRYRAALRPVYLRGGKGNSKNHCLHFLGAIFFCHFIYAGLQNFIPFISLPLQSLNFRFLAYYD